MGRPTIPDLSRLSLTFDEELFMEKRMENNASGSPIYVGWAPAGTLSSAAEWFIVKVTYDANNAVIHSQVSSNIPTFKYVWNDRATYF